MKPVKVKDNYSSYWKLVIMRKAGIAMLYAAILILILLFILK